MILNFAHRGSLTEAPENTLPAMEKALTHGTNAIELDVQLTKDNQLVVIHDHKLVRFNKSNPGLINDYRLDEIKTIDVGSAFSQKYKGTTLATLDEILEVVPSDVYVNVEIKNIPVIYDGIEEILLNCLEKHNRLKNVVISSFDHVALEKVQQIMPEINIGLLFYYRILRPWEYVKRCGLAITSVHPNVAFIDETFVEEFHKLGCKVYPFTVNDKKVYDRLINYGVDGVFSNNPEIFKMK